MTNAGQSHPDAEALAVWDLPLRLFHWLLVAAIAVAFLSSEEDGLLAGWHMAAGWVAAVLIVFRLVWGFVGSEHARFASFVRPSQALPHLRGLAMGRVERALGHNPAGALAMLLLIGTIAAVVATGYLTLQGGQDELHELIGWFLLGVIGVHVAAVIATSMLSGENLVRAMVTGRKRAADHPGATPARRASPVALLVALAAAGATIAAIRTLDPAAFLLQQREEAGEGEHAEANPAETIQAEEGEGDD